MKRGIVLLMAALMLLALSGCGQGGERDGKTAEGNEMYIEPAKLNEDEKKMAQLLGGMEGQTIFDFSADDTLNNVGLPYSTGQTIFDFSADDTVRSLIITTWKLENGQWVEYMLDSQRLDESSGRIALGFEDITAGCRIAVQTGSGFSASTRHEEADEELEGMGCTTAYLPQRKEIEYGEDIALVIQTFTDKNEVISYDPDYFEHPEEYEKLGYEGVFAVTACFSQEPLS